MDEGFTCAVDVQYRSVCKDLPKYSGTRYCVLHYSIMDKDLAEFTKAIEKKLKDKDFDFRGVYFPGKQNLASFLPNATFKGEADFSEATFQGEADFSGATFKGEAYFSNATFEGEANFSEATFEVGQAYFSGATLKETALFHLATFGREAIFSRATFEGEAHFSGATFEGEASFIDATFKKKADFIGTTRKEEAGSTEVSTTFKKEAIFSNATFEGETDFSYATFKKKAEFSYATFKEEVGFIDACFEGWAEFVGATFKERAEFIRTTFEGTARFVRATFEEVVVFRFLKAFPQTHLRFEAAVIEKPERFSFHSTHLRPSWFIDVDAQRFDFSDVEWFRIPDAAQAQEDESKLARLELKKEIEAIEAQGHAPSRSLRKLQETCRKLMDNAEETRNYATANELHYWSMELLRKQGWWRRLGLIGTLYWLLSGYGERPRRAFLVLVGMGTLFAILYVMVAGSIDHVGQAFLYSLAAMVRLTGVPAMAPLTKLLQPSEPGLFQFLVTAEGILGPLQIALLALAVRRRVMR